MRESRRVIRGYVSVIVIVPLALLIGIIGCNLFSDPEITIYPTSVQNGKLVIAHRATFRVSVAGRK